MFAFQISTYNYTTEATTYAKASCCILGKYSSTVLTNHYIYARYSHIRLSIV